VKNIASNIKDSAAVAFVAFLLFGPFLGLQLKDGANGALKLGARPELLAIAVGLTFAARMVLLLWQDNKPARKPQDRLSVVMTKSGKYVGPVVLLLAIALPFIPGIATANIDLGVLILTYIMLGWGLNIVVGLAGLLDLGYVAFYAVGAYSFALLSHYFGLSFWECLPLCGILAAAWGIFLGFPVLRLRGDYLAIVTLAFGEIIRLVITNWVALTGGPNGIYDIPHPTLFGLSFDMDGGPGTFSDYFNIDPDPSQRITYLYYIILALALLTNWVTLRLRKQPLGRAWEALREGFISPDSFTFIESATVLAIVVLGGAGSQLGVVLAAIVMIGVPAELQSLQIYRMLIFGIALVVIMVVRPRGFISTRRPTVSLGKAKIISADLISEGHG
jgi:branched-chain amino acid transport system permease protein